MLNICYQSNMRFVINMWHWSWRFIGIACYHVELERFGVTLVAKEKQQKAFGWHFANSLKENVGKKVFLRQKLLSLKMSEEETIASHLNALMLLIDQLAIVGIDLLEEDQVMTLLWCPTISHMVMLGGIMEKLGLNDLVNLLIHEKMKQKLFVE